MWSFNLEGKFHKIEFWDSKISNKKKVTVDAKELLNNKSESKNFSYSFKIDKHFFSILHNNDEFELRIDNRSFLEILSDERCGKLSKKKEKEKEKKEDNSDDDDKNYKEDSPNKRQKKK